MECLVGARARHLDLDFKALKIGLNGVQNPDDQLVILTVGFERGQFPGIPNPGFLAMELLEGYKAPEPAPVAPLGYGFDLIISAPPDAVGVFCPDLGDDSHGLQGTGFITHVRGG